MGRYEGWIPTSGLCHVQFAVKDPDVTPSGKPTKLGVVVATPTVPVPGAAVQQWIWAAVVVPTRPLKVASIIIVCATSSTTTVAKPVPGEATGGDLDGPSSDAMKVNVAASKVTGAANERRSNGAGRDEFQYFYFHNKIPFSRPTTLSLLRKIINQLIAIYLHQRVQPYLCHETFTNLAVQTERPPRGGLSEI